jgi:hypothetical protein
VPGDNCGLLIGEGEGGAEMEEGAAGGLDTVLGGLDAAPSSVKRHAFAGYHDPVLLRYTEHLLRRHLLAAQGGGRDQLGAFEFPPEERQEEQGHGQQGCDAGAKGTGT